MAVSPQNESSRKLQIILLLFAFVGSLLFIPLRHALARQSEGFALACLTIPVAPLFLLYLIAIVRDRFRKARK